MKSTMEKYAGRIEKNEVDPVIQYNGLTSGLLLDPLQERTPLEILGFGILRLTSEPVFMETGKKEAVFVPQDGAFEAEVDGERFQGERRGGPFALGPGKSNASALYIPSNSKLKIWGEGETAFFEAPALSQKKPFYRSSAQISVVSRGDWVWRRDVVSLVSPNDGSSNLIVGETYSPPGFWSGTPLHRHDRDDPASGESDHEEIYYHRFSWEKKGKDDFDPYGVQILMDDQQLKKAYLITDKCVMAIPGGCHPVVASPVSELIYLWGLGGRKTELAMKDIPEFAHLKRFEEFFKVLEADREKKKISRERLQDLSAPYRFSKEEFVLLAATLVEKGYEIN
jgi:5-deoxy-glucuronate isomerase